MTSPPLCPEKDAAIATAILNHDGATQDALAA